MKMNDRERLFLFAFIALVVMIVGVVVLDRVTSAFESRDARIIELRREIKENEQKVRLARQDLQRLNEYKRRSLPSDAATAHSHFQEWLFGMTEMSFPAESVTVQSAGEKELPSKVRQFSFAVGAEGTLDQLTEFLYQVYSANSLHRIYSLNVTRQEDSRALKIGMVFEGLSLPAADDFAPAKTEVEAAKAAVARPQDAKQIAIADPVLLNNRLWFDTMAAQASQNIDQQLRYLVASAAVSSTTQLFGLGGTLIAVGAAASSVWLDAAYAELSIRLRYPDRQLADYQTAILRRNLFGLANRPPELASVQPPTAVTNQPYSLTLSGTDPDELDTLQFWLEEDAPAGATLQLAGSKSARLEWRPAKPGTYDFAVRVVDSGWPAESTVERFQIRVEDPRPVEPPSRPAPTPTFDVTAHTVLTAILRGSDGRHSVWFHERPTNVMHKKFQGDEFDVGTANVVVKEIRSDQVTVEVNGELRELSENDRLDGGKPPPAATRAQTTATSSSGQNSSDGFASRGTPSSDQRPNNNSTTAPATADPGDLEEKYPLVDPRYLRYYTSLFTQSDLNGNGTLEKDEWGEMRTDPAPADVDRDEIVTLDEFILWRAATNR